MEGPVSGRRIKRRTIRNIIIATGIVFTLIVVVTGGSYLSKQYLAKRQEEKSVSLEVIAGKIADRISRSIQNVSSDLDKIIEDGEIIQFLETFDSGSLEAKAESWSEKIPTALKLRIFVPGQYREDRESIPPLGFASLALLHQVERTNKKSEVELHGFKTENAHVVMIHPVQDAQGNLIGLIHASLKVDPYIELIEPADFANGYAELVQDAGGQSLVLNKVGNAGNKQGTPATAAIDGASWSVKYWPKVSKVTEVESDFDNLLFYIAGFLIVVAVAGVFYSRRKKQSGDVEENNDSSVVFGGAVRAIMDGLHPGLEKLIPNLPKMGTNKPIKPLSTGLEGDDITKISKPPVKPVKNKQPAVVKVKSATEQQINKPAPVKKETLPESTEVEPSSGADAADEMTAATTEQVPDVIFRAYDIRGVVGKSLTVNGVNLIGKAFGSEAMSHGQSVVVGRDGRTSSQELSNALIQGLRSTGANVIDIGQVPTPVLYFATHQLETNNGVMVTGSHNGPEYNGLKMVLGGETLSGDSIQSIKQSISSGNFSSGQGDLQTVDITADYIRRATEDIPVALGGAFRIVVDCGNGVAGGIAPQVYRALGHDVTELYCEVDGKFPNHHPDPSQPANLQTLIDKVKELQADIGFAFDGDGDRLGVVDGAGNIIWPDRQMMLFAKDVLSRNQGAKIIFDVKCSRHLKDVIESNGGEALMWKTGHSLIKNKMKELVSPLAGEMSGHIFFKERWYGFDDAIYAGARLLEILASDKRNPTDVFAELPGGVATPELRIPMAEKNHMKFMQALIKKAEFQDAEITDVDGFRADFAEGWGLIRPSNTTPCLIARFEAEDDASLKKIQNRFSELIHMIIPDIKLPF